VLVRMIGSNAHRLNRLLTNLLDLDRMSRGIIDPNRRLVDVTKVVAAALDECKTDSHPIHLTTRSPVFAEVDAAQVERIIENLVTNAIRYTAAGTPIWVSVAPSHGGVLLTVEDAGPGVPEALRETIFEPFHQGPEVVSHSPGVGIGLSLVSRFAQLHGGRAWVGDREGGGASFKVLLPEKRTAIPREDHSEDAPLGADGYTSTSNESELTSSSP
jgi:signal transduction histidine kinase